MPGSSSRRRAARTWCAAALCLLLGAGALAAPEAPAGEGATPGASVGLLGSRDQRSAYYAATRLVERVLTSYGIAFASGEYPKPPVGRVGVAILLPGNPSKADADRLAAWLAAGGKAVCLGYPGEEMGRALKVAFEPPVDSPVDSPEVSGLACDAARLPGGPTLWTLYPPRVSEPRGERGDACAWWVDLAGQRTPRVAGWLTSDALALGATPEPSDSEGLARLLLAGLARFDEGLVREALGARLASYGAVGTFRGLGAVQAYVATQGDDVARRSLDTAMESWKSAQAAADGGSIATLVESTVSADTLLAEAICAAERSGISEVRAAFVAPEGGDRIAALAEATTKAGLNALFLYAGDALHPLYPTTAVPDAGELPDSFGANLSALSSGEAAPSVFAWRACFYAGTLSDEARSSLGKEGRLAVAGTGERAAYLCPSDERNLAAEAAAVADLVTRYPVAGVVLDFVRFPSANYCYCDACRDGYRAYDLERGSTWPPVAEDQRASYEAWRVHAVTQAVRRLAAAAREARPGIVVAATCFGQPRSARAVAGQEPSEWLGPEGVDMLIPLLYGEPQTEIASRTRALALSVGGRALLVPARAPWPSRDAPQSALETISELRTLRAAQADGIAFSALSLQRGREQALALGLGAFRKPAERPWSVPLSVSLSAPPLAGAAPNAYTAEQPAEVSWEFPGIADASLMLTARSLDQDTRRDLGSLVLAEGKARAVAALPPGQWRIFAEGMAHDQAGAPVRIARLGPAFRVLSPDEANAAREAVTRAGRLDIAIWQDSRAAQALSDELRSLPGEKRVRAISSLDERELAETDLLVVQDPAETRPFESDTARELLDRWVLGGGRLLLLHNAVGHRGMPQLFPTLAWAQEGDRSRANEVRIASRDHPAGRLLEQTPTLPTVNSDHALVRALRREDGLLVDEPLTNAELYVAIAGGYGAGRVVFCGLGLGFESGTTDFTSDATRLPRDDAKLYLGLIGWLAEGLGPPPGQGPAPGGPGSQQPPRP